MPSNDIDGSIIVILADYEALAIYHLLTSIPELCGPIEDKIVRKIARDLDLSEPSP